MKPNEFYSYSPKQFFLTVEGFQEKQIDSYKQTRLIMFTLVSLLGDQKNKPKTPEALWELPGDEVKAQSTDQELENLYNRFIDERSRSKISDRS